MFCRFVAACFVASVVIAAGAVMSLLLQFPREGAWILTTAWCFVPVAWGLWAMLAPSSWVPGRLPIWGAILGVAAGIAAGPILNIPMRVGGLSGARWIPLVAGPILYYFIWLLVGVAYRSLRVADRSGTAGTGQEG